MTNSNSVNKPIENVKKERTRARFEMFVRIPEDLPFRFYGNKLTWAYRGDRYGDTDPAKQLISLLNNLKTHGAKYVTAEVYDTALPKDEGQRLILKVSFGEVKHNRIIEYKELLKNYSVPPILKQ